MSVSVPLSTRVVDFVPASVEANDNPPTFRIRPGSVADRHQFRADLVGRLGQYPSDGDLFDLALRAIDASRQPGWTGAEWDETDRAALSALVESARAQGEAMADWVLRSAVVGEADGPAPDAEPGLWDRWVELDGHLREHYQPLAAAYSRRVRWAQEQPRAAFRRFVRGWTGVFDAAGAPLPCRRGMSDVEAECFAALEAAAPDLVIEVGRRCVELLHADLPMRKKSGSPSGSSESPTPSPATPKTPDAASTADPGASAAGPEPTTTA